MDATSIAVIIASIPVAGIVGGMAAWQTSKVTAARVKLEDRSMTAKLPAEVDSIAIAGADAAVLVMNRALDVAAQQNGSLVARVTELEALREKDRAEFEAARKADQEEMQRLREQVADLREQVRVAETHLAEARDTGDRLAARVEELMKNQAQRGTPKRKGQ